MLSQPNLLMSFVSAANHGNRRADLMLSVKSDWLVLIYENVIGLDASRDVL